MLLRLVAHEIRCCIDTVFLLNSLELLKSVPYGFVPLSDLNGRVHVTLTLFDAPVDFTVLCDSVRNFLGCGHLTIWFTHLGQWVVSEIPGVRRF